MAGGLSEEATEIACSSSYGGVAYCSSRVATGPSRSWKKLVAPPDANPGESIRGTSGRLERAGKVNYRTFSFGGVKGQTISTLCFQKRT